MIFHRSDDAETTVILRRPVLGRVVDSNRRFIMTQEKKRKKFFVHEKGVTYFTKQTERRVLFIMTMVMLIWGVVEYSRDLF